MQIRSKYKSVYVYAHTGAEFETQCTSMQSHANQCKSTQTDANQLELAVLCYVELVFVSICRTKSVVCVSLVSWAVFSTSVEFLFEGHPGSIGSRTNMCCPSLVACTRTNLVAFPQATACTLWRPPSLVLDLC